MCINYTEKLLLDYRYMDSKNIVPRFEFGFGLSYTTFAYSALSITASGTSQVIKFAVSNTGSFAGTEIPQVYLAYPESAGEPKKVLRGFEEVILDVGTSSTVTITLSKRDFRYTSSLVFDVFAHIAVQYLGHPEPVVCQTFGNIHRFRGRVDQGHQID
ncbi:hypothetical protein DXG03_008622 [Asterophora parasitica]|uniref:beta-glucosidase n=1 Tax=Asterophora parasitica TaxID=117018 RepID=A0A9P7FY59_9AGAR|nr:hypothetical protein DXG03_008622 [Asterophora parasitica]